MKIISFINNKKIFIFLWAAIIAISLIIAFNQRSIINESQNYRIVDETEISYGVFSPFQISENWFYEDENASQADVLTNSDLIVRVSASGNRKFKHDSILSEVSVEEVYKGNKDLLGKSIYVYEWATVHMRDNRLIYISKDGYNMMNDSEQYYLFLKFNQMPEQYNYSEEDKLTYLLTNIYKSKYNVNTNRDMGILPENQMENTRNYGYVKLWDIIPTSEEQIERYLSNRENALKLLTQS